jgi:hypothetical protein
LSKSPLGKSGLFSKNSLYSCFIFSSQNLFIKYKVNGVSGSSILTSMVASPSLTEDELLIAQSTGRTVRQLYCPNVWFEVRTSVR